MRWRLARILVTGAAGFIGRALCAGLVERGHSVLGCSRRPAEPILDFELRPIGDIDSTTDWSGHLDRIDVVVRLTLFSGAQVVVLAECKHQGRPIARDEF